VVGVQVEIVRYVADSQPGWVECCLIDVHGRRWSFVEKVPIVTQAALGASSTYPQPGVIACEVVGRAGGVASIDTANPWGIKSLEGETRFEVPEGSLVEW
jgi:hypothetical protein